MKHLKKFNEEIGNPHHPHSFDRIEEFIKLADKIINYVEQGDEPSNTDILSELGDLCNEMTFTSEELQQVINSGRISDPNNFLQIILDETLSDEEKVNVVMLSTEKASNLYLDGYKKLNLFPIVDELNSNKQHFYILSDEEIKEGDWVLNLLNDKIQKVTKEKYPYCSLGTWKKIIATTDESLKWEFKEVQMSRMFFFL